MPILTLEELKTLKQTKGQLLGLDLGEKMIGLSILILPGLFPAL